MALAFVAIPVSAEPPPETVREMEGLIDALRDSGCEFQRNGRWYDGGRAATHLRRKQAWLLERDLISSSEQFIERAGSRSSLTGRPYQVRCPGADPMPSARWLNETLESLRARTSPSR
ncbi:DUF5329 domain-containing protein [Lysobacter spongiae]|uniref:DUF5329 domain-containing protein n=2 Tax=Marilutibacter spongiae TaxID=2025720 RepID=A0A7W3TLX3_9GAMM|nr:DUF5329 domain-containing protein [Lysobacter spongiae]